MMDFSVVPHANFIFSASALAAIEDIRRDWTRQYAGETPDVVSVAWGTLTPNDGMGREMPIVSFYTRDERPQIEPYIQMVSGLETIFYATEIHLPLFDGQVLDFSKERFFFLRPSG
jgi:hypothetical protein